MVRFAVIGCGRISEVHLKALSEAKNAQLCAVCDIIEEKAKKRALEYNVPYYLDIETMLKEQKPDAALIGTPSGMHGEHAEICALNGVNVLCEKPLEITTEKIDRMIRVCEENHVKLGGIFQRRTYTAAVASKNAINSGNIGTPVFCSGTFNYSRTQEYYDSDAWRGTWALDGGGALMNQGIHGVDLLQYLAGDVVSVFGVAKTLSRHIEVEDTLSAVIEFQSGAIGVIQATTSVYPGYPRRLEINGDNGTIVVEETAITKMDIAGSKTEDITIRPSFATSASSANAINADYHTAQLNDVIDAIKEHRAPAVDIVEGRKAVDIILAIYRSAREGRKVYIEELNPKPNKLFC